MKRLMLAALIVLLGTQNAFALASCWPLSGIPPVSNGLNVCPPFDRTTIGRQSGSSSYTLRSQEKPWSITTINPNWPADCSTAVWVSALLPLPVVPQTSV